MIFDPIYMMIMAGTFALSGLTSLMVKSKFRAGQKVAIRSGLSGFQVAQAILRDAGITDVRIEQHRGFLSDHYNPLSKTLVLSPDVYNGSDAAAAGVAAHEVGHAIQHAQAYTPMWLRSALVPIANIGSNLGPWIIITGIFLGAAQGLGHTIALIGVGLFAVATLFTVVTVPVEFDASARAKHHLLQSGIIGPGREFSAVSGVLTAAGLTYVAAAASSIMMLLYWAHKAGLLGGRR